MRSDKGHRRGPRSAASSRDRDSKVETRALRLSILIVCEGKETEPNYFKSLIAFHQLNTVNVRCRIDIEGAARQGMSLVKYAEGIYEADRKAYDEIWCVFDKDSLSPDDFNRAITHTHSHDCLSVAWTNEAWELWYVLHFQFLDHAPTQGGRGVARDWYNDRLDDLLKPLGRRRYDKADPKLYADLGTERRDQAIRNAKKLQTLNAAHGERYHLCVPGTMVHALVERLLKLAPENASPISDSF